MKIKECLKKNKLIHYIYKAIKGYKKDEIYEYVIKEGQSFGDIKIDNIGWNQNIVYEIEVSGRGYGFFAAYFRVVDALAYADYLNAKPLVRWTKDFLYAEECEFLQTNNPFEYYFEPTSDVRVITQQHSVIKFDNEDRNYIITGIVGQLTKRHTLSEEQKSAYIDRAILTIDKYIKFNQHTQDILENDMKSLLGNKRTLGIHVRGGDLRKAVFNHPIAVPLDEHLEHAEKILKEYEFEQIFLATDEKEAVDAFVEKFGDKVVYYKDTFRGENGQWVCWMNAERENHNYKLGLEILRDAETLAHCNGLIAGHSNIILYVELRLRMMQHELEYFHIINKGTNDSGKTIATLVKEGERSRRQSTNK